MNNEISKILIICMTLEGIITYINNFFVIGESHYQMILSLILGIFVSITYNIDLLKLVNIESTIPYVGCILTGILFSRGSNYIYDLINNIIKIK